MNGLHNIVTIHRVNLARATYKAGHVTLMEAKGKMSVKTIEDSEDVYREQQEA